MFGEMRAAARSSLQARVGGWLLRPALRRVRDRYDYRRYGGAPLLGVNGNVLIGHGASDAAAVASAIRAAARAAEQDVLAALSQAVGGAPGTAANES
jgi:glycerol-3-phosphate acyltransferase PlsX